MILNKKSADYYPAKISRLMNMALKKGIIIETKQLYSGYQITFIDKNKNESGINFISSKKECEDE
ncbi:hypothetical protein QUW36_01820 [Clostridium cadaveris]|uniref:hypothetical protein n=1 Tax=Clostridium cadaveris TaxID=1529 RepID=UPI0025A38E02|nr:hypothetical protein [Clostridium cadaveris]MDM8310786.1 hypothetical protein [Clostridium cadaveris]